jgi:hypothetical protein
MADASMDGRLMQIAKKLQAAAEGGFGPFGVEGHGFRLRPPLAEEQVAAFEYRRRRSR